MSFAKTMRSRHEVERTRVLNDAFRIMVGRGCRTCLTSSVAALPRRERRLIRHAISTFDDFTEENDPTGERDFGTFEAFGQRFVFKIDYYAPDMKRESFDPSDNRVTRRVLTVMKPDEF